MEIINKLLTSTVPNKIILTRDGTSDDTTYVLK